MVQLEDHETTASGNHLSKTCCSERFCQGNAKAIERKGPDFCTLSELKANFE